MLAVFIAVASLTAVVRTRKGSLDNQFIGVTCALALFGAIGLGGVAAAGRPPPARR